MMAQSVWWNLVAGSPSIGGGTTKKHLIYSWFKGVDDTLFRVSSFVFFFSGDVGVTRENRNVTLFLLFFWGVVLTRELDSWAENARQGKCFDLCAWRVWVCRRFFFSVTGSCHCDAVMLRAWKLEDSACASGWKGGRILRQIATILMRFSNHFCRNFPCVTVLLKVKVINWKQVSWVFRYSKSPRKKIRSIYFISVALWTL